MEQKLIRVNNFTLSYVEENPNAQHTLFFIHGNSGTWRTWTYQLNNPLFKNYRLVAIDLPGHGNSSYSSNPTEDYSPINTGKLMAQAISILQNNLPFTLTGFSYGTNVIAEMLNYEIHPTGIVFVSSCVIGEGAGLGDLLVNSEDSIYFSDDVSAEKAKNFIAARLKFYNQDTLEMYLQDYLMTKAPFRSTLLQTALKGKVSDEISLLKRKGLPLLIVFGLEDDYVQINYLDKLLLPTWKNTIYKPEKAGHFVQTDRPEDFNQLLFDYIEDRFKATRS